MHDVAHGHNFDGMLVLLTCALGMVFGAPLQRAFARRIIKHNFSMQSHQRACQGSQEQLMGNTIRVLRPLQGPVVRMSNTMHAAPVAIGDCTAGHLTHLMGR